MTGLPARTVELVNERGLHARASAEFVRTAQGYDAVVRVSYSGETVGTASVMDLMMLGARFGSMIEISA